MAQSRVRDLDSERADSSRPRILLSPACCDVTLISHFILIECTCVFLYSQHTPCQLPPYAC